jgi:hypothetical protein
MEEGTFIIIKANHKDRIAIVAKALAMGWRFHKVCLKLDDNIREHPYLCFNAYIKHTRQNTLNYLHFWGCYSSENSKNLVDCDKVGIEAILNAINFESIDADLFKRIEDI